MYANYRNLDQFADRSSQPSMMYFFYGTLCDSDIQRLILGYHPGPRQLQRAILHGFRRKQAEGRSYPVLIRAPGGVVDGLLFRPARPDDMGRLERYEGPEYVARSLLVRPVRGIGSRRAHVFLPACPAQGTAQGTARGQALAAAKADWRLQQWQRRHKTAFLQSLHSQGPMPCASR